MDINFQPHQHYIFTVEDEAGQPQLQTLRYAQNGHGGNVFGVAAIPESLAMYGITDYRMVMAVTQQHALAQAGDQDLSGINTYDRARFSAAEDHYGPLQDIIRLNHTYKVELKLPGYTVADQIRDLMPGQNYHDIGRVFSAPHPRDRHQTVKGILYNVPTWHETVFGKQQTMTENSAVVCLSRQQTYGPDAYVISSAQEFDEFWRPQAQGLHSMQAARITSKAPFNYVLPQN